MKDLAKQKAADHRCIVDVPQTVAKEVLCSLMDYFYTGVLRIDEKPMFATQLAMAIGYFQIDMLNHVCGLLMGQQLTEDLAPR